MMKNLARRWHNSMKPLVIIKKIFSIIIKTIAYAVVFFIFLILVLIALFYRRDVAREKLETSYFTEQSQYVNVADANLHVRIRGNGMPVLLLHGSFASLHTWDAWETELSKNFKTISLDLPGHGLSGPSINEIYTTDYYASLVFSLADSLQLDSFIIGGNSMGGNVAWKIALQAPHRVKKLILVNASGFWSAPAKEDTIINNKIQKRPLIFRILGNDKLAQLLTKITPRFLFKMNLQQVYGDPQKIEEEEIDRYYELMLREGNRKATLQRLKQTSKNLQDSIKYIHVPTLIIWGEKDAWIPVSHAHKFHKAIENSELVIYPDAGHVPMEEIPDTSIIPVVNFLLK